MKTVKQIEQELHRRVMRCSIEARGIWYQMRHTIDHESERPGHLQDGARPIFAEQLAHSAGCPAERVARCLSELTAAGVLDVTDAGIWFSPPLAQAFGVRSSSQRRAARSRARQGGARSALRAPAVTPDVAPVVAPLVRGHPPPPSSLPPYTPLLSPPAPLWASGEAKASVPDAQAAAGGDGTGAAGADGTGQAGKKRRGKRVRTDAEHAVWQQFRRWFCEECWPRYHGGIAYDFDAPERPEKRSINYQACWTFLDHDAIGFDLERAKKTADYFALFCADHNPSWDVPLQRLAKRADHYWQKSQLPRSSRVIGPTPTLASDERRGLYPADLSNLRVSGGNAAAG